MSTLASRGFLLMIGTVLSVNAFSLEHFIDPLLSFSEDNGNLALEEILKSETANNAARLFLSYINSTTTISASYALVIILGLSLALLALLGIAYLSASAMFAGPSVQSYYGKRSLPDGADSLDFNWTRIIQILHEMDEHFRRLGAQKSEDDCRKILICKLIESNDIQYLNDNQSKLVKLTNELSKLYKRKNENAELSEAKKQLLLDMKAYHEAQIYGRQTGQCSVAYPKCSNN